MVEIRVATEQDIPFLWNMLYEAAIVAPDMQKLSKEDVLNKPFIKKYLEDWGKERDFALVAEDENKQKLGATWFRVFNNQNPGFGFVSSDVPELSIGVIPAARDQGIGSQLLQSICQKAKEQGYKALSLSVDRNNRAYQLYIRHGFEDAHVSKPEETSITLEVISKPTRFRHSGKPIGASRIRNEKPILDKPE